MTRWTYTTVGLPSPLSQADHEALLNDYGLHEWELCGSEYGQYVFKKPAQLVVPTLTTIAADLASLSLRRRDGEIMVMDRPEESLADFLRRHRDEIGESRE